MVECLGKGIIPHVITDNGKDGYEIGIPYEEAETDVEGAEPEELKKCLHAGELSEACKEVTEAEVLAVTGGKVGSCACGRISVAL